MKQPTLTFTIDDKPITYPVSIITWDNTGRLWSFGFHQSSDTYMFYRDLNNDRYLNSYGNLEATISFE